MNKLTFFIIAFIICSLDSFAQKTIHVIDSQSKEPIEMVYVAILRSDSTMIDYTYTETDGSCILTTNHDAKYVSFSYLGYTAIIKNVDNISDGSSVCLDPSNAFKLRNVTIKSERLNTQGDTITYSVKGYSLPQDRTIADVIAKMPGLEVNENGAIMFNGRPINKFYIEGMDLLDNKYALASNNIDYRKVRSVEVLQNHQKVAALRGKVFSENAALNIVLEDDAKSVPIGTLDVQGGFSDSQYDDTLFKDRIMSMLFSKKRQNLSLYKSTNLGQNLYQEITPIEMGEDNIFTEIESSLVSVVSIPSAGISSELQTFNRAHLAAVNELFKLKKEKFFRVQADYFAEKSDRDVQRIRTIHLSDDTKYTDSEILSKTDKKHHIDLSANYELNSSNCYLSDKISGSMIWRRSEGSFDNGTLYSSPDQKYFQNKLKFVKAFGSGTVLSITSDASFNGMPQRLRLFNGKEEKVSYNNLSSSNSLSLKRNINGFFITGILGMNYKRQNLDAEINNIRNVADQRFSQSDMFASINGDYSIGKLRLSGNIMVHRLDVGMDSNDYYRYYTNGRLSVSYKLNDISSMTLSYNRQNSIYDIRNQFAGELWTDYKTQVSYKSVNDIGDINTINLHYSYIQPLSGTFISANINVNRGKEIFSTESDFDNDYYKIHYVYAPNSNYGYGANFRIGKSLNIWKSSLSFFSSLNNAHGNELINHKLEGYDSMNSSMKLQYSARPSIWLSIECSANWSYSDISSSNWSHKRNKVSYEFNLTTPLSQKSEIGMNNSLTRLVEDNSKFFISDIYYRYTKGRMSFSFEITNLFNTVQFVNEIVSNTVISRTLYNIRPREFLAGISLQL